MLANENTREAFAQGALTTPFSRLLIKWFIGFFALGILLVAAISYKSWQDESGDMRNNLAIQAGFAAKNTQAVFDLLGMSIEMLGQMLEKTDVLAAPEHARPTLLEYKTSHPEIVAISLIRPDGMTLLQSNIPPGQPLPDLRQNPDTLHDFLFDLNNTYIYSIDRNITGLGVRGWHFAFRHTVTDRQGHPQFVIQAMISMASAEMLWSDLPLFPGSRVGLIRNDGYLQLLWPDVEIGNIFTQPQQGALIDTMLANPGMISGVYQGSSPLDNDQRIGAFSHLPNANMAAFVSVPRHLLLTRWWQQNFPVLLSLLLYLVAISVAGFKLAAMERQYVRRLEALAAFPEGTPDIVLSMDAHGHIGYINPHGHQTLAELGLGANEIQQLLPNDFRDMAAECLANGNTLEAIELEYQQRTFLWTFAPLQSQGVIYCYAHEITRKIRAEAEARDALIEKQAADAANQAKSLFLANMSHEIRTPLTAIIGFSETLLDSRQSMSDRVDSIQTIIRSSRHLLTIINDILDLSKIEAGKLDIESLVVSPFRIVSDVGAITQLQAEAKGLAFSIDYRYPLPGTITTDPVRLKQVLLNLCSNAIKFTNTGSVRIHVSYNRTANQIRFDVSDTGIGLSQTQQTRLFSAFSQADPSTTRKYGGTGLGLHLSRQLAEKLGGALTLTSTPDVGTTFTVTVTAGPQAKLTFVDALPASENNSSVENSQHVPVKLGGMVLIAEDNPDNQRLVTLYIKKLGAHSLTADNGLEALNLALANYYDLILMDMQMPVMDGLKATRLLREKGYTGKIVALTANAMQEDIKHCLDAGCDNFLSKPINRDRFNEMLARYLPVATPNEPTLQPITSELLADGHEVQELIQLFVERLPDNLAAIRQAFHTLDWDTLKKHIHDLKGVSGSMGFPKMSQLSMELEFAIAKRDQDEILRLLKQIQTVCDQIRLGAVA